MAAAMVTATIVDAATLLMLESPAMPGFFILSDIGTAATQPESITIYLMLSLGGQPSMRLPMLPRLLVVCSMERLQLIDQLGIIRINAINTGTQ